MKKMDLKKIVLIFLGALIVSALMVLIYKGIIAPDTPITGGQNDDVTWWQFLFH